MRHARLLALTLLASAFLISSAPAVSQALETAARKSELSVFAGAQTLNPDYHGSPHDIGFLGGANYTYYLRSPILPSLEVRGTYTGRGSMAGEKTVLAGARLDLHMRSLHRFRPYGNFLVGVGEIDFAHPMPTGRGPYAHDNSVVYNYGFGLDYEFIHHVALQAEFQQQKWNLAGPQDPYTLSPTSIDVGLRYRIPFRDRDHR